MAKRFIPIRLLITIVFCLAHHTSALAHGDPAAVSQPAQFLIITPQQWAKQMQEYADFKGVIQSLNTEVCSLELILESNADAADDAERLKQYLYTRWAESDGALRYVLLVGDADVIPVRYMVLDRNTDAAFNYAFYPCDLYYADLADAGGEFDNWNGASDDFHATYFGEVRGEHNKADPINFDGVSYVPEIAVGRWPVSNDVALETVITKSQYYSQEVSVLNSIPVTNRLPRAAYLTTSGWIESRGMMDQMRDDMPATWSHARRYYADSTRDDQTPPPTAREVVRLLNEGVDLVLHAGHGTGDSWHDSISTTSITELTNRDHLPIMFSVGCSTAVFATLPPYEPYLDSDGVTHDGTNNGEVFDAPPPPPAVYQAGLYNASGLGEQLLRASLDGAVAYIGCNTGSQPCAMTLMRGFVKGYNAATSTGDALGVTVGDCWQSALAYYYEAEKLASIQPSNSWYPPSIFFQGMKFMLFGDPSLPMRAPVDIRKDVGGPEEWVRAAPDVLDAYAIAHRGASGTVPENTLAAFTAAHRQGADVIETDLVLTADNQLVCFHDLTLEGVTNVAEVYPDRVREDGKWYVIDFTWQELQRLAVIGRGEMGISGKWRLMIPSYDDLLTLVHALNKESGREVGILTEIKDPKFHADAEKDIASHVVDTLESHGLNHGYSRIVVQSFDFDVLVQLRRDLDCQIPLVYLVDKDEEVPDARLDQLADIVDGIAPNWKSIGPAGRTDGQDPDLIERAHLRGLMVLGYTFGDDTEQMARFVQKYGIDGIITDFTATGRQAVSERGFAWLKFRPGDGPFSGGPELPRNLRPVPRLDDYGLIWHDEFDGTALDETKWKHSRLGPRRDAINVTDAVSLDGNGHLTITTSRVEAADGTARYHTGMIDTLGHFGTAYGYFEARMQLQTEVGHWSAFWIHTHSMGNPIGDVATAGTEIDVAELLHNGKHESAVQHTLHWDGYGEHHKSQGRLVPIDGLNDGFHTFGLLWTPAEYVFLVDGRETWRTRTAVSQRPQYMILSCEVGDWAGDIGEAELPDSLIVDYVRVYQPMKLRHWQAMIDWRTLK
ncbi:MAG: family 16 glycosylhydrolase [Planctomycetes bacterium]|nr:family 16 glycosylhydrolase [Planctomycetota bacterium]